MASVTKDSYNLMRPVNCVLRTTRESGGFYPMSKDRAFNHLGWPSWAGVLAGFLIMTAPVAHAGPDAVDWYHWYRNLYGYLNSVGGVLCSPGTDLRFHQDGKITAISRDATCQASLENLNYPLPENAPIQQLSLPIRKHSYWPLSHRALRELITLQLPPTNVDTLR